MLCAIPIHSAAPGELLTQKLGLEIRIGTRRFMKRSHREVPLVNSSQEAPARAPNDSLGDGPPRGRSRGAIGRLHHRRGRGGRDMRGVRALPAVEIDLGVAALRFGGVGAGRHRVGLGLRWFGLIFLLAVPGILFVV